MVPDSALWMAHLDRMSAERILVSIVLLLFWRDLIYLRKSVRGMISVDSSVSTYLDARPRFYALRTQYAPYILCLLSFHAEA